MKKKEVLIIFVLAVLVTMGLSWTNFGLETTKYSKPGFGFPLSFVHFGFCAGFSCNLDFSTLPFLFNLLFWFLVIFGIWQMVKWIKGQIWKK